jgi:hypothetical protein
MEPPPLGAGEAVLHSERVDRIIKLLSTPGLLVVTSRRLLFVPRNRAFIPLARLSILEASLDEIREFSRGSRIEGLKGGVPGVRPLTITLTNGRRLAFQSGNAERLQELIQSACHEGRGA